MKKLAALILSVSAIAQVATPLVVNPGSGTETGEIRLRERRSNGSNYVGLRSPSATSTDLVWDLPASDGTLGQALVTNGAGVLSWSSVAGTSFPVCTSTTGNDTYTCTVSGFTAYSAGYCIILQADTANTGTATVNISAVGAKSILRYGGSALSNNDILANTPVMICYDGTQFQLPPSASPGSGSFLDGGNSFGATATLGTNDNYDLNIERNNTTLINVGSSGINMAPSGTANFYNKVRKLEITGISGETAFWDIQTAANMASSSNFKLRDNAGSRAILIDRAIAGSPLNNIGMFGNVIPRLRATADGDAVNDSTLPAMGSSGARWSTVYGGAADFSGNGAIGGTLDVTGNLSAAVINATGSPAYRVSGTTVINASREATFTGLTIPTGAVNNYVWTGNGSGVGSWQATQACATCIVNGGNTFGAAATIGTNDANILNFETDNAARWRITAAGMLQPAADDTYDIGELTSARVRGVYAQIVDTAKGGGTGDYLQTRKLQLFDNTGSTTAASYWDLNVVMSGAGAFQESYFYIRDNGGNKVFQSERIRSGSAVDRTFWYTDLLPDTSLGQNLGSSSYRWNDIFSATIDTTGGANIGGNLSAGVINATGSPAYRVSGTTVINASRDATFVGLTASGATYLQTTGIGEASPAKGLLSVYGHNGYAYTPYNIVASARFRTGANSAILFGTTIPNTSGWTRGMYWSYLTEDWTLSRFKDDESAVPINDLYVAADGRVGIGTAAVTEELTVNGSIDVIGSGAIEVAGTTVIDASRNATVANLTITGSCTGCPGGLPAVDTTSIVTGSSDTSKQLRFEVDGLTTATTRVLTPQNASYTLAGTNIGQTFTSAQTFNDTVTVNAQSWVINGNSFVLDRATRGTNQKVYWTVGASSSTAGAWSAGTTPSGAVSRWVLDHNGTEHFVMEENGFLATTAGANFGGIVSTTTFNATGSPAYRVSGTTVINASRDATFVGLTLTGSVSSDLTPSANNTYILGGGSFRWANVYTSNFNISGNVTGDLIPATTDTYVLGSSTNYWNMVRTTSIRTHGGNVQPATSLSGSLGAATGRWLKTWTQDLDVTGTIIPPSGTAFTGTKTVRAAGGASDCTLTFSAGIMTGGTC